MESAKKENGHQNTVLTVIDLASVEDLFRKFELVTIVLLVDMLTILETKKSCVQRILDFALLQNPLPCFVCTYKLYRLLTNVNFCLTSICAYEILMLDCDIEILIHTAV